MSRSNPNHRLANPIFDLALRNKLILTIPELRSNPPCWCGGTHDEWGIHSFHCQVCNKKAAHDLIKNSAQHFLQRVLAEGEYIQHSTTLEVEPPGICPSNLERKPFDIAFTPDPHPTSTTAPAIPHGKIGLDITIAPAHKLIPLTDPALDVEEQVAANAELHLQKSERKKLMPEATYDAQTREVLTYGDTFIGDINNQNFLLYPIAIDKDGGIGPLGRLFLLGEQPRKPQKPFPEWRPHATTMYRRITDTRAPQGVANTANAHWRATRSRPFFGHSYTAPTPREFLMQKLGLCITKAMALHLRNSFKKFGAHPNRQFVAAPPGFDPETNPRTNLIDTLR
jgi:hypothetical protein